MTIPHRFPADPNYRAVVRGLLQMHRLAGAGQFESPEADAVREAMETPWEALSDNEKKRVGGLSEDLNAIIDGEPSSEISASDLQSQIKVLQIVEAKKRGEWDRALEMLRQWRRFISPALAAYLRGTTWRDAGDNEVAAVFLDHACRLEPENSIFRAMRLDVLKSADPQRAAEEARVALADETTPPMLVVYAADIAFKNARTAAAAEAISAYERLIPILENTLHRLEGRQDSAPPLIGMITVMLAMMNTQLGKTQLACEYLSRAIHDHPLDAGLLIMRGHLLYTANPQAAAADFEQAVQLHADSVWPYFYLAHYYVVNHRFEESRQMSEVGLRMRCSARRSSELHEVLAMSQAGLGYPEHVVRRTFENAIRIDLSNDRARRNLEVFEKAVSSHAPFPMNWEQRSSEASFSEELWSDVGQFHGAGGVFEPV